MIGSLHVDFHQRRLIFSMPHMTLELAPGEASLLVAFQNQGTSLEAETGDGPAPTPDPYIRFGGPAVLLGTAVFGNPLVQDWIEDILGTRTQVAPGVTFDPSTR